MPKCLYVPAYIISCVFWELGFSLQQWVFSGSVHTFSNSHRLALRGALLFLQLFRFSILLRLLHAGRNKIFTSVSLRKVPRCLYHPLLESPGPAWVPFGRGAEASKQSYCKEVLKTTQRALQQKSCRVHSDFQTAGTPRGCSTWEHMHAREPLLPAELLCLGILLLICFNASRGETLIPQLSMQLGRLIFAHGRGEGFLRIYFEKLRFLGALPLKCIWQLTSSLKAPASTSSFSCLEFVFQSCLSDSVVITLSLSAVQEGRAAPERSPVFLCRASKAPCCTRRDLQPISLCLSLHWVRHPDTTHSSLCTAWKVVTNCYC